MSATHPPATTDAHSNPGPPRLEAQLPPPVLPALRPMLVGFQQRLITFLFQQAVCEVCSPLSQSLLARGGICCTLNPFCEESAGVERAVQGYAQVLSA